MDREIAGLRGPALVNYADHLSRSIKKRTA